MAAHLSRRDLKALSVSSYRRIRPRIVFGRGRRKRDNEYICSELVFECFKAAGSVFPYDESGFISPENIRTHSAVQAKWRVH